MLGHCTCASAHSKKEQGDKYSMPQLRLWARCIVSENHESTDEPPDLPPITGNGPKKPRKQSLGICDGTKC